METVGSCLAAHQHHWEGKEHVAGYRRPHPSRPAFAHLPAAPGGDHPRVLSDHSGRAKLGAGQAFPQPSSHLAHGGGSLDMQPPPAAACPLFLPPRPHAQQQQQQPGAQQGALPHCQHAGSLPAPRAPPLGGRCAPAATARPFHPARADPCAEPAWNSLPAHFHSQQQQHYGYPAVQFAAQPSQLPPHMLYQHHHTAAIGGARQQQQQQHCEATAAVSWATVQQHQAALAAAAAAQQAGAGVPPPQPARRSRLRRPCARRSLGSMFDMAATLQQRDQQELAAMAAAARGGSPAGRGRRGEPTGVFAAGESGRPPGSPCCRAPAGRAGQGR